MVICAFSCIVGISLSYSGLKEKKIQQSDLTLSFSNTTKGGGNTQENGQGGETIYNNYSDNLYYEYNSTLSGYEVMGCYSDNSTTINIPQYYNDEEVKGIGDFAFCHYCELTSITIPDGVISVGGSAFSYCSGLTSITIPDSVTSIGSQAFYNCSELTSVIIGNGVTSIGYMAFYYCSGLTSITFKGTKAQWQAISKGKDWKYNVPTSCVVHCTDGDLSI